MKHPFSNVAFEHVVYIGAGRGEDLRALTQTLTAKSWIAVEGSGRNIEVLNELREDLQSRGISIDIEHKVIAPREDSVTWYQYNLSEFDGIHKAIELKALFPGLKLLNSEVVEPTSLNELLSSIDIKGSNNLLLIDIPAQGLDLVKALARSTYQSAFKFMGISSQSEKLFDASTDVEELRQWCSENGYHSRNEEVEDPDFPIAYVVLSDKELGLIKEIERLKTLNKETLSREADIKKELEELKQEHADAVARELDTNKNFEQVRQELDKALAREADRTKELERVKQEHADAVARELDTNKNLEQVRRERDKALAREADRTKELERVKQEHADAVARELDTNKNLEQVRQERDKALTRASDISKELQQIRELNKKLKTDNDALSNKVEELQKQTETTHQKTLDLEQALKQKTEDHEKLRKVKAESENDYKKELSNLKRALDGKNEILHQKEQELEHYKRMEANYNREFYRVESQLELLKELMSNGKS